MISKSHFVPILSSFIFILYIAWEEVRDDNNPEVDWLIAGYDGSSKTDITILAKGHGGLKECSNVLPDALPVFGGLRLNDNKFATFFYVDEQTSVLKKGRASMHKNGTSYVWDTYSIFLYTYLYWAILLRNEIIIFFPSFPLLLRCHECLGRMCYGN